MQRQGRPKSNTREKTVEIDVISLLSVSFLVLMGVLLFFLLLHFTKQFVPIKSFEITSDSVYDAAELSLVAGINEGDKLYRIDVEAAEKAIVQKCPYVKSIDIKRTLFGKLKFDVECYKPIWYLEIAGDFYVLDGDLRVLEETQDRGRLYEDDLIFITMPHLKSAIVGQKLEFGDGEGEIEETKKIMEIILSSPVFEMICSADIDNRYDIHFEFDRISVADGIIDLDDVFIVNVGGYTRLEAKLEYILMAIEKEDIEGVIGGTIDVSEVGNKVSIRPIYAQ